MKKVGVILANGFEEMEALGTVDILRRAGIPVKTITINDSKEVTGAHNIAVLADSTFSDSDFSEIDVIVLPGGMPGAKNLNAHNGLRETIKTFNNNKKMVAAICAAPMVLGSLGVVEGKKATCYPGFEPELIGAKTTGDGVVVDDNITTGKGPGYVFDFALKLVEQIAGQQTRKEVQEALLL
ncbi:MAG: DJ-1 family glyoxalase III [Fermentimonas sp.]|jgi:4-methyl-5(b-hydroxyethyl)-thiazole monophosphate biosynthesis